MASFPRDRFDEIPADVQRVGAHRVPRPRGRGWVRFGWAVLATAVLVVGGLFAYSLYDPSFHVPFTDRQTEPPSETPTEEPPAEAVTDPSTIDPAVLAKLTISVLNGTATSGLSNTAADQIAAAGWPDPTRAAASANNETETVVYYSTPADEGIARGLMQLIGGADVRLSDAFPTASITIVLGSDYVPPAAG